MYLSFERLCLSSKVLTVNKSISEDDDIIAGHQKMSLKCPVGLYASLLFRRD